MHVTAFCNRYAAESSNRGCVRSYLSSPSKQGPKASIGKEGFGFPSSPIILVRWCGYSATYGYSTSDVPSWFFFFFATPSFECCLELASWHLRWIEVLSEDTETLLRADPGWSHTLDRGSWRCCRRQNYTQGQCSVGSWNQQFMNFPVLSCFSHSVIWLMLTKAFVALKHAEYLVTLLLLVAAALTCTPQGDLHAGVTDVVGCHGCACPKPPETGIKIYFTKWKKHHESFYTKWNAAQEAEAIHCDMRVTQERSGIPVRWPRPGESTWSLLGCEEVWRLLPLTQAIWWWGILITEADASIRLKDVKHLQGLNCGTGIWQQKVLFLCSSQHSASKCLLPNKCWTPVVCHSARVHWAQNQQTSVKPEGIG